MSSGSKRLTIRASLTIAGTNFDTSLLPLSARRPQYPQPDVGAPMWVRLDIINY
jgi:hypothetical protein